MNPENPDSGRVFYRDVPALGLGCLGFTLATQMQPRWRNIKLSTILLNLIKPPYQTWKMRLSFFLKLTLMGFAVLNPSYEMKKGEVGKSR